MHLSTGGSSSPGSMRDIEFRQVRSIEGLPEGGPRTQEQPASHTCPASSTTSPNFARTETSGHKAEELFCLWNVLSDLIRAAAEQRLAGPSRGSSTPCTMRAGTLLTAEMADRRVLILGKIHGCTDRRRSRPRSMPVSSLPWRVWLPRAATAVAAAFRAGAPPAASRRFPCPPWA
jgi:hypothetical protein